MDVEALYRRYGPMVLRRCRRLLKDEGLALDAMQDTFVSLCRRQAQLDDRGASALLYQMATRTCLNQLRTLKRRPETRDDALLMRIACAGTAEGQAEARSVLRRLFGQVPDSTRTIAVMHLVDGMTLEAVAEAHGMSVSGIRKRLRRLKHELAALEAAHEEDHQ
ncbi:MAG: RNA polymerase sigma factor [Bradymonadia bacterium]